MKRLTDLLLITMISSFLTNCGCSDPSYLIDGSTFAFRLIDESTGENVFPDRFSPWAFEIIDEEGDTLDVDSRRGGQDGDFSFIIDPTGDTRLRYDNRNRRRYYLHLDSTDVDTLILFFVPRTDDCTEYLDDFEAYYNDELVAEGSGTCCYQARAIIKS